MNILAIDPGPEHSAVLQWDGTRIGHHSISTNPEVLAMIQSCRHDLVAIEGIYSYGMPVGAEVFETCYWIGRIMERCDQYNRHWKLVKRLDVKMHLCHTTSAKDPNIRQALIDRLGKPGTKKAPGTTYGIASHLWSALAIAVYAHDQLRNSNPAK